MYDSFEKIFMIRHCLTVHPLWLTYLCIHIIVMVK